MFLTELAVTAIALVLALAGGWWLVRLGLRPLEDVEATADSIAAGNLDQRVPGAEQSTEVGRLARALNVMLERIQAAFSARVASEARLKENEQHLRQFVADASHELRTPIAAVSAYAELFERVGAEHTEDLPRIVSGIRTETARMDRLVNDLLTLARLDEGVPMELAQVELVSLVSEAVRTATAVGPEWPVHFWAAQPVEVTADKDRLRQVVDNLLANVRAHTPEGTSTTVRVDQIGDQAEVEVRDSGPGMPETEARRVFERFYRADPARVADQRRERPRPLHRVGHRVCPRRHRDRHVRPWPGLDGQRPDPGDPAGARAGRGGSAAARIGPRGSTRLELLHRWPSAPSPRFTPHPQRSFTASRTPPGTMTAMTALAPYEADVDPRRIPVDVEIVVPVYNEAAQLVERVTELRRFLDESFPFRALVTVVDNASTDDTAQVAADLARSTTGVAAMHLPRKGRGYALRAAWSTSQAPVVAYMDVDLSTSLPALLPLVAPLLSGHRDVVIGSRLARGRARCAGSKARTDLALLQPVVEADPPRPLQRRTVRLQGVAP